MENLQQKRRKMMRNDGVGKTLSPTKPICWMPKSMNWLVHEIPVKSGQTSQPHLDSSPNGTPDPNPKEEAGDSATQKRKKRRKRKNSKSKLQDDVIVISDDDDASVDARIRQRKREIELKTNDKPRPLHKSVRTPQISNDVKQKIEMWMTLNNADRDELAVIIGTNPVHRGDLMRLRPGQWLNDEIVNAFGKMLELDAQYRRRTDRIKITSTFFYSALCSRKGTLEDRYRRAYRLGGIKRIQPNDILFIPVNSGNRHWFFCMVNLEMRQAWILDSLGGSSRVTTISSTLTKFLQHYKLLEPNEKLEASPGSTTRQPNGYDCGVFTCLFMYFAYLKLTGICDPRQLSLSKIELHNEAQSRAWRLWIAAMLLNVQ